MLIRLNHIFELRTKAIEVNSISLIKYYQYFYKTKICFFSIQYIFITKLIKGNWYLMQIIEEIYEKCKINSSIRLYERCIKYSLISLPMQYFNCRWMGLGWVYGMQWFQLHTCYLHKQFKSMNKE